MFKFTGSAFAFSLIFLASVVLAADLPKIKIENINGYEVHFVDIGRGDSFGASYQIKLGMLSESGRYMGRAHLLEHMVHKGTLRHPGISNYFELLRPLGVHVGASTGYTQTTYQASGPQRLSQTILDIFLAGLGGLDWNEESFAKEVDVVINEVVTEAMPKDHAAFHQMVYTQLLPKGHPWNHAPWGDIQSLKKMTMNDVKELYYANYRPSNIIVTIQGNFSDADFLKQVETWTKQSLQPPNIKADPQGYAQRYAPLNLNWAPSLFSDPQAPTESERRIFIESSTSKRTMITLEADLSTFKGKIETIEMLTGYLSMSAPGTLGYRLAAELGCVSDMGFYTERIGNKLQLFYTASLTDEGFHHVQEMNALIFEALRSVQLYGIPPKALELLKDSAKLHIDKAARSVQGFIDQYSVYTANKGQMQDQVDAMMSITPAETALVAKLFHPARALYLEMGPADLATLEEMETDPNYKRKYKFVDNRAALRKYSEIIEAPEAQIFAPQLKAIKLKGIQASAEDSFSQTEAQPYLKERATLDFRNDLPDTAVSVNFLVAPQDQKQLIASDLVMEAFSERFSGELNFLPFRYLAGPASGRATNKLSFTASGEDANSLASLEWMLEELANFVPTGEELDRARQNFVHGANQNYVSAYSATIALWEVAALVDPQYLTHHEGRDLARALTNEEIIRGWKDLRKASNKEYVLVGPFKSSHYQRLKSAAHKLSPRELDDATTKATWHLNAWPKQTLDIELPRADERAEGHGVVRAYQGPKLTDLKDYVAFAALDSLMHAKIKYYERDELGLGYIHGAQMRNLDNVHTHLIFRGQVDRESDILTTTRGWEHILESLRAGKITDKELQDSIDDVLNSYDQENTSARDVLSAYSGAQSTRFDAKAKQKMIAVARKLKPVDIMNVAKKYLLDPSAPTIQLTLRACEERLTKN